MSELVLWTGVFLVSLVIFGATLGLLLYRISKFKIISRISRGRKLFSYGISFIGLTAFNVVLAVFFGMINAAVIVLHVLLFWFIGDICLIVYKRLTHKKIKAPGITFIIALFVTAIYMVVAAYICFNVVTKNYSLTTSKDVGNLRIIHFADSHLGTVFSGEELNTYVEEMNKLGPDIVVITGDFVDDSTSKKDMIDGCQALSKLETKYGVYYCFGNHDKGYSDASHRGFSTEDLIAELEKNDVIVLQDESVLIDERFYIVGRQDKSEKERNVIRAEAKELVKDLDKSKYIIVLNHQPNDYDNEVDAQVDLVLSGHTHGGQLAPVNKFGEWIMVNDATYGLQRRQNTDFIVTSGIADWELYFKTGCTSEYVVIDIN